MFVQIPWLAEIIYCMPDANDMDLVREFVHNHSEAAFTELVRRHVSLVYSVARRCTDNDDDAQDVTQAVFIILARKAASLRARTVLAGWLYETTRYTAACVLRANARRRAREQEAYMESILTDTGVNDDWSQLVPHLEAAMSRLAERDRTLLALRFYENKSGMEAAALLGIREAAAHKRTARALDKLRKFLTRRGVVLTAAAIAGAVSANSVQAVPPALVKTISAVAMTKGLATGASTLPLVKGALKIMAWTKVKTAAVIGAGVFLAAGTTTIIVKEAIPSTSDAIYEAIFQHPDSNSLKLLESAPPTLIFRPTQFPQKIGKGSPWTRSGKFVAVNFPLNTLFGLAYGFRSEYVVFPDDFKFVYRNARLSVVADGVAVGKPILDRTGIEERYDFDFQSPQPKWLASAAEIYATQGVWNEQLNRAGLELVPSHELVRMLVVEMAKRIAFWPRRNLDSLSLF